MGEKLKITAKKNPIIPRMGVCDPHMHVFDGRVWLHASHDAMPGSEHFCTKDWQIWSSADCVEWQLESVVHPEDTFMGESTCCWAVDCIERDGKYYYYFSDGGSATGVAVGDSPAGPFKDALGRPLLDGTLTTTREYDPALFKDDDGEYYIVFGGPSWAYGEGCGYFIARLNKDMISLAEQPRRIELNHEADDKASLNKFGDKYYLSYGGFYAIADNVYGPYTYMGHTGASIDHTSYFEWNGQLFNAITIVDHYGEYRSSGICYTHIRENGELVTDPLIHEYGVGQYDSDWNKIEAEWFMRGENVTKKENRDIAGFWVSCTEEASLVYPKVRNLTGKIGFSFRGGCVGGKGQGGSVELRLNDETGPLLGTMPVQAKDYYGWHSVVYGTVEFDSPLPDTADICLVLKPDPGCELGVDFFHFFAEPLNNP
ncbi:MAG: family 43 glycosylhydrolase [Oscillospiraceae bacterium]|nr:family 43 glycosylhydrolase [Oscillospiraceae bacterium]